MSGVDAEPITLRDFFAAHAMNADLISSGSGDAQAEALAHAAANAGLTVEQQLAKDAYEVADAMMAERLKKRGKL